MTTQVTTGLIADGAVTAAKIASGAAASNLGYTPANKAGDTFTGTLASTGKAYMEIDALTDGATITPDFSVGNNFSVTLAGNRTLANPTNLTAGQSGIIFVSQDATGSRTLSYGSSWKFPGGTAPTLTTTASAVDAIVYTVRNGTSITAQLIANVG